MCGLYIDTNGCWHTHVYICKYVSVYTYSCIYSSIFISINTLTWSSIPSLHRKKLVDEQKSKAKAPWATDKFAWSLPVPHPHQYLGSNFPIFSAKRTGKPPFFAERCWIETLKVCRKSRQICLDSLSQSKNIKQFDKFHMKLSIHLRTQKKSSTSKVWEEEPKSSSKAFRMASCVGQRTISSVMDPSGA